MPTYCVMDQKEIPIERELRKAVTCSPGCANQLKQYRRKHKDKKVCRMCHRPSTADERILFQRWRRETFGAKKKGRPTKAKLTDGSTGKINTDLAAIVNNEVRRIHDGQFEERFGKPLPETEVSE